MAEKAQCLRSRQPGAEGGRQKWEFCSSSNLFYIARDRPIQKAVGHGRCTRIRLTTIATRTSA
jgi:hypothetical protein